MIDTPRLIELSFSDAIAIIAGAEDLPAHIRQHWPTSLRWVAKALGRPLEVVPARYSAVRGDLLRLHPAPLGVTCKTASNHKSNVKSALLWLHREKGVPKHGAPLKPNWGRLRAQIRDSLVRHRLSAFTRYCSAQAIKPSDVNEAVVDRFMTYRASVGMPGNAAFRRLMARAWNRNVGKIPGWPAHRLIEPPVKTKMDIAWEDFSLGLRQDIERYLDTLTRVRRNRVGQRIRPLKPSTLRTRRAELAAAARMAVKVGVPMEVLTSLSRLLNPDVVEKILDAYWRRNGDNPKQFTIDLAARFLAIAKETKCLDDPACERLDEMRRDLELQRRGGLTDKNIAFIRQVLTPGVWSRVVNLPGQLMAIARSQHMHAPVRAAVMAQIAVAIGILTLAPIRLANLARIRLDTNLIKPNGPDSNYWLMFPDYDVKNRVRLDYPLEPYLTRMIDEYIFDFRPTLLRGRNEDWLFPGQRGGAKEKISFSGQIKQRIYEATGLEMTVHQFRHAAGAIILKRRHGEYELVRRVLGHRSVQTTINAYIGLENIQASEIFSKLVIEQLDPGLEAAE